MKDISHNTGLTSSEIANLWSQYINDSMSVCILKYYLKSVEDKDIRSILKIALRLSLTHVDKIKGFLDKENYPVPKGFTKEDVDLAAPRLFSDTFMIVYMHIMTIHGLSGYAGAVSTSTRHDQIKYFTNCSAQAMGLYSRILNLMLEKGIASRPPNINPPSQIDYVEKQSFLTGWFGTRRPLNAVESSGIFFNMQKNAAKIVLELGFSQVARSKVIRDYLKRGANICDQHFDFFRSILAESHLPPPKKWDAEVTNSTVPPFSDKLMLFHIATLISTAIGYYGAAFSLSQRRDLAGKYSLLIVDITKYAEDGVNILIDNGWLEQPPTFDDRDSLMNKN
ncbi:DUF3231 family protein [Mesobacillus harenae]|uniref:DUF3231 family protein n=1 Tax=Mesobacillus harenae TaxID=2213203 RepID=UPI00158033FC|nr:DUF3231 family protein [Mesobacillus harenae]